MRELEDKTIVLSTHMLHLAEELCDKVLLLNKGRAVAYGNMNEIKAEFTEKRIIVEYEGTFPSHSFEVVNFGKGYVELVGEIEEIMARLIEERVRIRAFRIKEPSLEEIFLKKVRECQF